MSDATFNFQDLYHVGVRTANIEKAMSELGKSLRITWAEPQVREQPCYLPGKGMTSFPLKFTYSCEGPQHVELLESVPGAPWYGNDAPGVHHMGMWVDDVKATTDRFLAEGWTLEVCGAAPEDGYGSFSYVRAPSGFLLEPVTSAAKPMFEQWWAGGPLGPPAKK